MPGPAQDVAWEGSNVSPVWRVSSVTQAASQHTSLTAIRGSRSPNGAHSQPSSSSAARPCTFAVREGFSIVKENRRQSWFVFGPSENLPSPRQQGSPSAFDTSLHFRILGQRHPISHVLPAGMDALNFLDDDVLSGHVAGLLSRHIIPTVNGQVVAAVERAGQWVGTRRIWANGATEQQHSKEHSRQQSSLRYPEVQRLERLALAAQQQANPELAASIYEELVRIQPDADNYARLSKQFTDMTYVPSIKAVREKVVQLNTRAVEIADLAVATDPSRPLAHIARCVSRGRLALVSDNRTKVQLAKDAADDAAVALSLDPRSDLAHHLMGRWHYEMAQINAIARTLIRLIFGTSLMQGSFSEALVHYKTAAELCPGRVIHRVELGRTLLKLGNTEDAKQELAQALELEIEDINAQLQQRDAAILLTKLQSEGMQGLFYGHGSSPPPAQLSMGRREGPQPTAT